MVRRRERVEHLLREAEGEVVHLPLVSSGHVEHSGRELALQGQESQQADGVLRVRRVHRRHPGVRLGRLDLDERSQDDPQEPRHQPQEGGGQLHALLRPRPRRGQSRLCRVDERDEGGRAVGVRREAVELGDGVQDGGVGDDLGGQGVTQVTEDGGVGGGAGEGLREDGLGDLEGVPRGALRDHRLDLDAPLNVAPALPPRADQQGTEGGR